LFGLHESTFTFDFGSPWILVDLYFKCFGDYFFSFHKTKPFIVAETFLPFFIKTFIKTSAKTFLMLNYLQVKQEFDFDMTPPHRSRVTSLQRTKLTRRLVVDGAILFL